MTFIIKKVKNIFSTKKNNNITNNNNNFKNDNLNIKNEIINNNSNNNNNNININININNNNNNNNNNNIENNFSNENFNNINNNKFQNSPISSPNLSPSLNSIDSINLNKIIIQNIDNYETNGNILNMSSPSLNSSVAINNCIISDIQDIDWNNLINIELLNNSNNNNNNNNNNIIILVTFYNGYDDYNQVIIKSSNTMAQDVYASVLQVILKYPVPEMRLIDSCEEEFNKMSINLLKQSKLQSEQLFNIIQIQIEKPFFLIMEYKNGGKFFTQLNHKDYFSSHKNGEKKLKQLGKLLSFDLICNINNNICNFNYNNNNNNNNNNNISLNNSNNNLNLNLNNNNIFSNIIFYEQPDKNGWFVRIIYSTILCTSSLSFTPGYRNTMDRIKLLLFSIFQNPTTESLQIYHFRKYLSSDCNINLPSSSVHWSTNIQNGIAKGIDELVNSLNYQVFASAKQIVSNMIFSTTDQNNNVFINNNNNFTWKKGNNN
ncbi:hypothetical protein ACTFIY_002359 [Dictyostelium cf. discoideum]